MATAPSPRISRFPVPLPAGFRAGGVHCGLARAKYRYVQAGSQGVEAGVAHRIDAHRVVAFFFCLQARLEHAHVHQHGVVVAVTQGGAPVYGDELHLVTVAYALRRKLGGTIVHACLVHRDRDNDFDAFGHGKLQNLNFIQI